MKKILAILLALATLFSLCSCSLLGKDDGETTTAQNQADSNENDGGDSQTPSAEEYDDVKVQKIGTSKHNYVVYTDYDANMGGFTSLDGKFDTGAIYYGVSQSSADGYFYVATKADDDPENLDSVNNINIVDAYGKTLLEGYFKYIKKSDRFIVAAKVVEIAQDDHYDYFLTDRIVAMSAEDGEIKYDAEFYVYDLKTQKIIDGVKSDTDGIEAHGDFIFYKDMSGTQKRINANGHAVPENVSFYYDTKEAFYSTDPYGKATLYDSNNNALFSYDSENDYFITTYSNGYFHATKTVGEEKMNFLVDKTGKVVTAEFSSPSGVSANLEVYGNVVLFNVNKTGCKFQICDFNGKVLAETENVLSCFDAAQFDEAQYYTFYSTKGDMIIVSTEGEVVFEVYGDEAYERDSNNCAYKTAGEDTYYFCLKDKDFTIKADKYASEAPYLVEIDAENNLKDIIDVTTGETIISGYSGYTTQVNGADIYVYAQNGDGTSDIYLVRF